MAVPASRYRVSPFAYSDVLPPVEYLETDIVRRVTTPGLISLKKAHYYVGRAFVGEPVGLRATDRDGVLAVYYCGHQVATIDLHTKRCAQQ